jgi:hypothetical protein
MWTVFGLIPMILLSLMILSAEPAYKGRSLSSWLADLETTLPSTYRDAVVALHEMAAPSLPYLVGMLQSQDSDLRVRLMELAARQDVIHFHFVPASVKRERALMAFEALGQAAEPAARKLASLIAKGRDDGDLSRVLTRIGPGAALPLAKELHSKDKVIRNKVARLLECIDYGADETAIAGLLKCLKDKDANVRNSVAHALGKIGREPALVVPALIENLDDPNVEVRRTAAYALGKFENRANEAVPVLLKLTTDRDGRTRTAANVALSQIALGAAEKVEDFKP